MENKLIFCTGNLHKFEEAQKYLQDVEVIQKKLDLPEIQGTAEEIVKDKVKAAVKALHMPVIVDDTSLEFSALKGLPGPYIKVFEDNLGAAGLLKLIAAFDDKKVTAKCLIGFCLPGKEPEIFVGATEGTAVEPRGNREFGFDPIFLPIDAERTYGEMTLEEKNQVSHRGKALQQLNNYLQQL